MKTTVAAVCSLCEASCGILVDTDGDQILKVRGDPEDPLSKGHICPKAVGLRDLHEDPDLKRQPLRRIGEVWHEVSWDEALDEVAERLCGLRQRHGHDSVAAYFGTPTLHSYSAVLSSVVFLEALGTRNYYTSNSVDALPRLLTSYLLYGSQALLPVPDLDRASFLLILGANPVVSNGSVMTSPGCERRLKAIGARGGRIVLIDPRRSETAALADRHHFIKPGSDALLVLAMLRTIFAQGLFRSEKVADYLYGIDQLRELVEPFKPEEVSGATGISAGTIVGLARDFASAPTAVCYGRMGTSTQGFGTLATWAVDCLNIVTGNLDRPGGAMFSNPAVDLAAVAARLGQTGSFGRYKSRVSGFPEFSGELPAAALAEEMATEGEGRVRALVTHAGNPVLSFPNGGRLEAALPKLDFMVAIDVYLNETTRHADILLPPTVGLEREHYSMVQYAMAVRNTARYGGAAVLPRADARHDWQILLGLARRILERGGPGPRLFSTLLKRESLFDPRRVLSFAMRFGPHGPGWKPWASGLTLKKLRANPGGVDLGALRSALPGLLQTSDSRVHLVPAQMLAEVERIKMDFLCADAGAGEVAAEGSLRLIGRRDLRSANSWMHNCGVLQGGRDRCTLLINPQDAGRRGIEDGQVVEIRSSTAAVEAVVTLSSEMMAGVVSLPHGWGHHREGTELAVASKKPGVSFNDISDDRRVDRFSGCADFNGIPVEVTGLARQ
ncbi:MAG: molybdopterin-dependent oxidoreductase [Candidatus Binatia bacterium]